MTYNHNMLYMATRAIEKGLNLYDSQSANLWFRAEQKARRENGAFQAREGVIMAQICAAYLNESGPLDDAKDGESE